MGKTIQVLPLILPDKHERMPGWCTYTRDMAAAPIFKSSAAGLTARPRPRLPSGDRGTCCTMVSTWLPMR